MEGRCRVIAAYTHTLHASAVHAGQLRDKADNVYEGQNVPIDTRVIYLRHLGSVMVTTTTTTTTTTTIVLAAAAAMNGMQRNATEWNGIPKNQSME